MWNYRGIYINHRAGKTWLGLVLLVFFTSIAGYINSPKTATNFQPSKELVLDSKTKFKIHSYKRFSHKATIEKKIEKRTNPSHISLLFSQLVLVHLNQNFDTFLKIKSQRLWLLFYPILFGEKLHSYHVV